MNDILVRAEKSVALLKQALARKAGRFDESKHRRNPKGSKGGGKFAPKGGKGIPNVPTPFLPGATWEVTQAALFSDRARVIIREIEELGSNNLKPSDSDRLDSLRAVKVTGAKYARDRNPDTYKKFNGRLESLYPNDYYRITGRYRRYQ